MVIDDKLISYLEDLSCLTLSEEEKQRLPKELTKILGGMARLNELNTEDIAETSHPCHTGMVEDVNAFREDKVLPSFPRELILKNAARSDDKMFIAPRVME